MNTTRTISEKLSACGLKVTPQRIAVYQALLALGHVCTDDVVGEVHKTAPNISVATIYNTLDSLLEHGLISQLHTGNNKKYYDVSTHQHSHLYGKSNHRIEDFDDPTLEAMIREYIARQPIEGFDLADIQIQLVGEFTGQGQ